MPHLQRSSEKLSIGSHRRIQREKHNSALRSIHSFGMRSENRTLHLSALERLPFFSDSAYIKAVKSIKAKKAAILKTEAFAAFPPTVFELLTLCAFLIFRDEKCDYAVIETGLGGRLDATNVITPRLSVLTPIEKEHTAILGDSPAKIAAEKGGIIKANVPVQSSDQDEEVKAVLNQIAFGKNSEISYLSDSVKKIETEVSLSGTRVTVEPEFGPTETFTLTNIGEVFAKDAVTSISSKTFYRNIFTRLF